MRMDSAGWVEFLLNEIQNAERTEKELMGLPRTPCDAHSCRSATVGSIRVARRAGR